MRNEIAPWRDDEPQENTWAIVIWRHAMFPTPFAMYFSLEKQMWVECTDGRFEYEFPNKEVYWFPIPPLPATHLIRDAKE